MDEKKYKPLDLKSLSKKKSVIISSKQALKDVTLIDWSKEVMSGEKKVKVFTKV